ncbi:MAG TPA: 50S ribosomal protein L10 [Edaphocola sp.]|nr:50S ribosomal protein L10 [Edaphocola sp.]
MNTAQKQEAIELLKSKFSQYSNFYVTNTESLTVAQINSIRRACFEKQVEMTVAKNTLIKKALESLNDEKYTGVYEALHGVTALMFSDSPKEPAVILSAFRKDNPGDKPVLKAALIGEELFVGDQSLAQLKNIKTKNELIGEVISLLQSPISRVVSALQNKAENGTDAAPAEDAAPEAPAAE